MSRDAVRRFWDAYPAQIIALSGSETGRTFQRLEIDSYEAGGQEWTRLMPEEFMRRRGYDILPWLPALAGVTIGSKEATQKMKRDWQETVTDLFAENYYGYMSQLASEHGLQLMVQPYGTGASKPFNPINTHKIVRQLSAEATICAEFWAKPDNWDAANFPRIPLSRYFGTYSRATPEATALLQGSDAVLITALDEIAWLLNVRGSDIDYNPLVISYLLVTLDDVRWFVRKDVFSTPDEETAASFDELRADSIDIRDYDEVDIALSSLREAGVDRICLDFRGINLHLKEMVEGGEDAPEVVDAVSPVGLWKAVKTPVEIDLMREAHLEDGLVMEQFLYWLEQHAGQVNEWEAAQELGRLRATVPGYRGDSFETISAYGPGAALPHYSTPREGSALLEERSLYRVDSGGQYLFGTTDITRTVPLGPCSALEREDYTLVLKGHIALASAVFPEGTAGCQIDVLAREPLWQCKRNFGHGTGHGVGFFLGVHEGPQDIRQNFNPQALLPGMIVSDEPGIYREGMHGVRHENLLLVRELGTNDFGTWLGFEPLTLCHFETSVLERNLLTEEERNWLNAYHRRVYRTLSPRLPEEVALWLQQKTQAI